MKNTFGKFFLLCVLFIFASELLKNVLQFNQLLYNSLSEKLTSEQLSSYFEIQSNWRWIEYIFIPIYILLKTSIIATILYISAYFFSKKNIVFNSLWTIVIEAEFIFLLVPIFKIFWFYFIETKYKLEDFQYFFPLSALNIIGYKGLEVWFIYPFQTLNLFELAYIIYIANQLGKLTETNTDHGLKIIGYSYIPTLLLWVALIMFITLNIS